MHVSTIDAGRAGASRPFNILGWALAFWAFTYALQTMRAELLTPDFGIMSLTRFAGTGAGAFCFGLVLRWIRGAEDRLGGSHAIAILGSIVPASLVVLAARAAADLMLHGEVRDLNLDIRWILVWAGWFGLWASAALALQWERTCARETARIAAPVATARAAETARVEEPAPPLDLCEEAIEAIALELSSLPEASRAELARRLSDRAGYELADDWTGGGHNRRVDLIRRIARRLEERDRKPS